jgi:hypothetical protein
MIWKNPKIELPPENAIVCVLYQHWKEHKYMSTQMMCGEVEYSKLKDYCSVNSQDFTGSGSWRVSLKCPENEDNYLCSDDGLAWCFAHEFPYPTWIPHNLHWGKLE